MKYLQYIFITLSLLIIFIFLPNISQARQVSDTVTVNVNFDNASGTWESWCYRSNQSQCAGLVNIGNRIARGNIGNIGRGDVSEKLSATVTKNIDLRKGNAVMGSRFNMNVGESTNLATTSTTGNWTISSGAVKNSYMNGQTQTIFRNGNPGPNNSATSLKVLKGAVSSPIDNNSPTLSSSNNNVISCSGSSCTARGAGVANITASFPRNVGSFNARFWFEKTRRIYFGQCGRDDRRCDTIEYREYSQKDYSPNYSFSNITWTVTVAGSPNPNPNPNPNPTPDPSYPSPNVSFTIKKAGGTASNNSLTVDQGDRVEVEWQVTNRSGLTGCNLSTSGPSNLFSGSGYGRTVESAVPPINPDDTTYTVTLQCTGRTPAQINRGFTQTRTLTVRSYPVLSNCTIGDNRRSVSDANPSIDINLRVSNTNNYYNWAVKRRAEESFGSNTRKNNPSNPDTLALKNISYTGTSFGRYTPSVRVTNKDGRSRTISCPSIANLGDSNIREVR